jgi:hypothetical protein
MYYPERSLKELHRNEKVGLSTKYLKKLSNNKILLIESAYQAKHLQTLNL